VLIAPRVMRLIRAARDAADPLFPFRQRFHLPPGVIYLDGNSLGAMPVSTPARLQAAIEQEWGGA